MTTPGIRRRNAILARQGFGGGLGDLPLPDFLPSVAPKPVADHKVLGNALPSLFSRFDPRGVIGGFLDLIPAIPVVDPALRSGLDIGSAALGSGNVDAFERLKAGRPDPRQLFENPVSIINRRPEVTSVEAQGLVEDAQGRVLTMADVLEDSSKFRRSSVGAVLAPAVAAPIRGVSPRGMALVTLFTTAAALAKNPEKAKEIWEYIKRLESVSVFGGFRDMSPPGTPVRPPPEGAEALPGLVPPQIPSGLPPSGQRAIVPELPGFMLKGQPPEVTNLLEASQKSLRNLGRQGGTIIPPSLGTVDTPLPPFPRSTRSQRSLSRPNPLPGEIARKTVIAEQNRPPISQVGRVQSPQQGRLFDTPELPQVLPNPTTREKIPQLRPGEQRNIGEKREKTLEKVDLLRDMRVVASFEDDLEVTRQGLIDELDDFDSQTPAEMGVSEERYFDLREQIIDEIDNVDYEIDVGRYEDELEGGAKYIISADDGRKWDAIVSVDPGDDRILHLDLGRIDISNRYPGGPRQFSRSELNDLGIELAKSFPDAEMVKGVRVTPGISGRRGHPESRLDLNLLRRRFPQQFQ